MCGTIKDIVVSSVLADGGMDLVVSNLKDGSQRTVQQNVGRSLHRIPDRSAAGLNGKNGQGQTESGLISFIGKENDPWEIRSLDPMTGEVKKITEYVRKDR